MHAEYTRRQRERSRERRREERGEEGEEGERDWKEELLDALVDNDTVPPDRFERLARRLLREAGFINTSVTGRSGDGGIDGMAPTGSH